jgi:hypothetical protein
MNENTSALGLMSQLKQSQLFGDNYGDFFNFEGPNPILDYFVKDIAEYFDKILMECNTLTGFQVDILHKIFTAFNIIAKKIDPNRLSFEFAFNGDSELVLFRNTGTKLINLILNPDECFAFSSIPKNPNNPKSLIFYDEDFDDFERLAYEFFS